MQSQVSHSNNLGDTAGHGETAAVGLPGAVYPVTARGGRREDIYLDDRDRAGFLALRGELWVSAASALATGLFRRSRQ